MVPHLPAVAGEEAPAVVMVEGGLVMDGGEDCVVAVVGLAGIGAKEQAPVTGQTTPCGPPFVALELREPLTVTSRLTIAEESAWRQRVQRKKTVIRSMLWKASELT